ncbi:MAG: amidohydrolase [Dehalococcoidia bacterium]
MKMRTNRLKGRTVAAVLALLAVPLVHGGFAPVSDEVQGVVAPDAIYHNGKVVTADDGFRLAQAFAVKGDRLVAVADDASVLALAGPDTRVEDLGGKTVLPGIYDNHIHLGISADTATQNWREVYTVDELENALRQRAAEVGPGEWVLGRVPRFYWPNDQCPESDWLDRVVPDRPVAITRGHLMMLNSVALEMAGISAETVDPEGGWIVRDADGAPTGHLYETPAKRMVTHLFPPPGDLSPEAARQSLRAQLSELLEQGYTSVNVPGLRPEQLLGFQEVYERWGDELPRLTVQIRVRPGFDAHDDVEVGIREAKAEIDNLAFATGFGNDRLKLGAIKMSIDGGVSAPSYWSLEPYANRSDFTGVVRIPEEALYEVSKFAHDKGWQLGIHAIGDAAVVMAVDVLERVLAESPREDHRHYLHHVSVKPPEETIRKMARSGISVASQPAFNYWLGSFLVESLEGERLETNNPQASLVRRGVRVSHGTDDDHEDPWVVMWSAVTRTGWGDVRRGEEQEAMTVEQAIRATTNESAWMSFDEDNRGSLEPGKYADFVVLHDDVLTIDPDQIRDVRVERTVVGGKEVFRDSP